MFRVYISTVRLPVTIDAYSPGIIQYHNGGYTKLRDCKHRVTLAMKRVKNGIAENDEVLVKQYVSELKAAYQAFEREHELQYLARDADGIQMGDEYLIQVMHGYTACLINAK